MKKLLCLLSAISMVFSLAVLPTKANEMVEVSSATELVEAIEAGSNVKIVEDITVNDLDSMNGNNNTFITIDANQAITIDLNGHVLDVKSTKNVNTNVILNNGSLTINDTSESKTGKIIYNYSGPSCNYGSWGTYLLSNGNGSTFVLNGGTLENTTSVATHIYYTINSTTYGEAVTNVTINGGHVINHNYTAIRSFENASVGKVVLTVNGGTITGTTGIYLQNPSAKVYSQGELIINGGTINSTRTEKQAVYVYGYGVENIDGLNIEVNGGVLNGYIHIFPETEDKEAVKVSDNFKVSKETLKYDTGTYSFYYTLECAHKNTTVVNVKESTCVEEGYTGDTVCNNCGHVENGESIKTLDHVHVLDESTVKEATCTEEGYTGDKKCSCGDTIPGESIKMLDHVHVLDESTVKEATCTEEGYTGDKKCSCGDTISGESIKMLDHVHVLDESTVKEATCTEEGYTGDKKCSCGDIINGEVIKMVDHSYVNGECECGAKEETDEPVDEPIEEPEINTEVEELPTIDSSESEEVVVGTDESSKEVMNDTLNEIIENLKEDKEVNNVSEEVVEAIKEAYENGDDVDLVTELVVETIDEEDVNENTLKLILDEANNSTILQYLDLSVLVNVVVNNEVKATGNVHELSEAMTFTIALPKELAKVESGYRRTYYVIREHNGEIEKLDVTVNEDGTLSFKTDRFSTYALAYEDVKVTQTPITSDTAFVGLYMLMAVLSFEILVILKIKKELSR